MKRKISHGLAAALALFGTLAVGSRFLVAEGRPPGNEALAVEFAGKVVQVQTTSGKTFVLEDVKVVQLGAQYFLSGAGIRKYRGLWWEGVPIRVRLSSVVAYFPMSLEQFDKTIGKLDEE